MRRQQPALRHLTWAESREEAWAMASQLAEVIRETPRLRGWLVGVRPSAEGFEVYVTKRH